MRFTSFGGVELDGRLFEAEGATAGVVLAIVLLLEAGLLMVAANTGFLGGPAVLAAAGLSRLGLAPDNARALYDSLTTYKGFIAYARTLVLLRECVDIHGPWLESNEFCLDVINADLLAFVKG